MAFNILSLLPILIGWGISALGGKDKQTQTTTQTIPPTGYQSPLLGLLDPAMANMLMQNIGRYSGAGMPGGKGLDMSMMNQIMSLIGPEFEKLMVGYKTGGKTEEEKLAAAKLCEQTCKDKFPSTGISGTPDRIKNIMACIKDCKKAAGILV